MEKSDAIKNLDKNIANAKRDKIKDNSGNWIVFDDYGFEYGYINKEDKFVKYESKDFDKGGAMYLPMDKYVFGKPKSIGAAGAILNMVVSLIKVLVFAILIVLNIASDDIKYWLITIYFVLFCFGIVAFDESYKFYNGRINRKMFSGISGIIGGSITGSILILVYKTPLEYEA